MWGWAVFMGSAAVIAACFIYDMNQKDEPPFGMWLYVMFVGFSVFPLLNTLIALYLLATRVQIVTRK